MQKDWRIAENRDEPRVLALGEGSDVVARCSAVVAHATALRDVFRNARSRIERMTALVFTSAPDARLIRCRSRSSALRSSRGTRA